MTPLTEDLNPPHARSLSAFLNRTPPSTARHAPIRWYWLVLIWIVAALVMASHRPSSLLHPQFWAEDGEIWYQQAYQNGPLLPLVQTQAGYFQTFPRLAADAALHVPFHLAPLIMNLFALVVEGLPVAFLLSSRAAEWGPFRVRAAMALVYLCLPNSAEWHATVTNSQWVFSLLAIMVLLAALPRNWMARAFDLAVLTFCGLTGPFCILLLPIAWIMAWQRSNCWRIVCASLVTALAAVQAWAVVANRHASVDLGASIPMLFRILGLRLFFGALGGTFGRLVFPTVPLILLAAFAIVGFLFMGIALRKSSLELKLFTLYGFAVLAAALRSPSAPTSAMPQWMGLLYGAGSRYFLISMIAFLLCVGRVALHAHPRWLRAAAIATLCIFPFGAVHNWVDRAHGSQMRSYAGFHGGTPLRGGVTGNYHDLTH